MRQIFRDLCSLTTSLRRWYPLLVVLLCALNGCGPSASIRQYQVEKDVPQHRMLAAILLQPEKAWFFKVTGDNQQVGDLEGDFESFLKSVRFEGDEPAWDLPASWKQKPGNQFRFATLEIETDGDPLELSVSSLPNPGSRDTGYLLANVNRWRGQLGLPPTTVAQLEKEARKFALDGEAETELTVVNLVGNLAGGGRGSNAPFMNRAAAGAERPAMPADHPPVEETSVKFDAPDSWSEGQKVVSRGGIRISRAAAFEVSKEDQKVEITITRLPDRGPNALLGNINRWRGQIQLEPIDSLEEAGKKLTVDGIESDYVELIGPKDAILGAIVRQPGAGGQPGTMWFVKLQGNHDLALEERSRFEAFVQSLNFE